MKKEAILYKKLRDNKVKCNVCQRRCVIPEGKTGWCMTRVNEGGTLYSLIYGEVSFVSINPIEKKPVFHFYPGKQVAFPWKPWVQLQMPWMPELGYSPLERRFAGDRISVA